MSDDTTDENGAEASWAEALAEQEAAEMKSDPSGAAPADFGQLEDDSILNDFSPENNLEMILDIPVTLSVEIGRTRINISNLLKLNQGSVVELDRLAGEPMDVIVNGTLVAHGEVVVVNEKFGIRLTDIISPTERVKKLK